MHNTSKRAQCSKGNLMSSFNHDTRKHNVGLLNLAEEFGNASRAYKLMGFRETRFYR